MSSRANRHFLLFLWIAANIQSKYLLPCKEEHSTAGLVSANQRRQPGMMIMYFIKRESVLIAYRTPSLLWDAQAYLHAHLRRPTCACCWGGHYHISSDERSSLTCHYKGAQCIAGLQSACICYRQGWLQQLYLPKWSQGGLWQQEGSHRCYLQWDTWTYRACQLLQCTLPTAHDQSINNLCRHECWMVSLCHCYAMQQIVNL